MSASYLDIVSRFACEAQLDDLSPEARERGLWILMDSVPVIAAGMQVKEMQQLAHRQLADAAPGGASVLGTKRRCNPLDAALLNGTAGTWLELDEGNLYAKGHPGIQVVPAALAVAQSREVTGAELLLAVTLGYEICARISQASNVRLAVHPHGTYGVIGAAIAAGRLHGLEPAQMRELINVSATLGLATSRNSLLEGATVRNLYTGHSGHMGQMALRLVQCGFTGERDAPASIYGAVLADKFDADTVVRGLGDEWLIARNYFKLHCTGRYVHSAIDALQDALGSAPAGERIDSARIARIDVRAYKLAAMLSGQQVTTSFGARFSVPFALATILVHGASTLEGFEQAAVDNPAVQSLAARVHVQEDAGHTAAFPAVQRCDLVITMEDGNVLRGHCEITKGEPGNPHTVEQWRGKFFALGDAVWGHATTERLYDAFQGLAQARNVRSLFDPFEL